MFNAIVNFSLKQPLVVMAGAVVVIVIGLWQTASLPIDVFPDLDRPRVTIITEAPGLAPEEVDRLINIPLESALRGATNVQDVRSSASVGISVIIVEFDWGTDIYTDRQIVNERLAVVKGRLPEGVESQLAPISSIMGQVMLVGMYVDEDARRPGEEPTTMLELREQADWIVRRRLMNVDGVAQVFTMGGENGGQRQVQVLVDPNKLRQYGVTLHQVENAVAESNENATGGYLSTGSHELLVRSLGRIETIGELRSLPVDAEHQPPIQLGQVAEIKNGPEISRGTAAVNAQHAVMLVVVKQPGADTRQITAESLAVLESTQQSLPGDVVINPQVYRMDRFIDRAVANVMEALRDGGILVVIVLFLFLLNPRTTVITLTAIPLSLLITVLIFSWWGLSINTMTLGGLAVAIGELVDDAIVDVENIHRRLRENRLLAQPRSALLVVYDASVEIRNSIVFGTMIVVLVFLPLLALGGMEGRLFTPLGIAYIVSILASLLVSITVTPILCYWLLARRWAWPVAAALLVPPLAFALAVWLLPQGAIIWQAIAAAPLAALMFLLLWLIERFTTGEREGPLVRGLNWIAGGVIRASIQWRWAVLALAALATAASLVKLGGLGRNFLPPFNEGAVQLSIFLPPGTSLEESDRITGQVDRELLKLDFVEQVGRRTGRAEEDEHVAGVNFSEIIIELDPHSTKDRAQQLDEIRDAADRVPGVESASGRVTTEQPISHLMSHMVSGVKAQIAIKIFGDDLESLRQIAEQVRAAIEGTPGVVDLAVEQQTLIPQLQVQLDRKKLAQRGLTPGAVNHVVETAMHGRALSQHYEGDAHFDLVLRLDDRFRHDVDALKNLAIDLPAGGTVPLEDVAEVLPDRAGPNQVSRENGRRLIVVQCNTEGRPLSEVKDDIQARLMPVEQRLSTYGTGYHIEYGGQFEREESATQMILLLGLASLLGVFLVLYALFRSVNLALQVMAALPLAAIGAVAALVFTGQSLSVPAMVGFISLAGIASRNGILLMSHYLHLVRHEGESVSLEMVVRAGQERLSPVLMTALTSGIGLLPLALAADEPGKEVLYPIATVIIGGLLTSTLLEFLVRPALFWTFGVGTAKRLAEEHRRDVASTGGGQAAMEA